MLSQNFCDVTSLQQAVSFLAELLFTITCNIQQMGDVGGVDEMGGLGETGGGEIEGVHNVGGV